MISNPFFQNRHQKVHPVVICSCCCSSWHSKIAFAYQRLDFQQDRTCSFHRTCHNRSRCIFRAPIQHKFWRIFHLPKTISSHFKYTNLIRRTKTIFHSSKNPVRCMPVSFKIQNRIYHMFQYSWTGDSSFFCNMSDNKNRNPKPFCKLHQRICCLSDLRHTSRCGTDFFTVHCLNRINDHGIWFFLFNHIADQFQISLTKQKQMIIKFSHPLCTQFNLAKRFFPWYVQNLSFFFCQFLTHLQEQRWLTDSRITAY